MAERQRQSAAARLLACGALAAARCGGVRIGAQIIVEIEEHRGAFRGGVEQVFEFSERVRLDDVAFVRGHEPFHVAFAGENVEMVEPEIVHDLLQLAIAVDGARDLGHRELFDDALRLAAVVGNGARDGVGIDGQRSRACLRRRRRESRGFASGCEADCFIGEMASLENVAAVARFGDAALDPRACLAP